MTVTIDDLRAELTALRGRVAELTDRAEISALIDRYVTLLDTQDENGYDETWPPTVFTDDVLLHFPIGTHEGIDGVARFHYEAKARFDRTLHLSANHAIRLDGDRGTVRFHVVATHVHRREAGEQGAPAALFDIGGHYGGVVVRTSQGWRFKEWSFNLTWADGPGPDGTPVL
ncbi:nuclear transport factor 2 family protein [Kitasatospora sp. NPDC056531]|uniref:nuclear transport factor 2 family protein n=1 Tax=Kitasatospora sp. NPDC056531 TaxID=3345856 RepID=UPI0036CD0521